MQEHLICNLCGSDCKFIFYENYEKLKNHFKISHYLCMDEKCLSRGYVAFKTPEELDLHKSRYHREGIQNEGEVKLPTNKKKINIMLACFYYYSLLLIVKLTI